MTEQDSTQRFTNRADNYARFRPSYPAAVLDCLRDECGLNAASVVADIGSGTGILTGQLLDRAGTVYAVEPNAAMRAEAEKALGGRANFVSVDGMAEATTLPGGSVDLVTAGQAFHWFDVEPTRREFRRILRPDGCVALVWNKRDAHDGGFTQAHEALLGEFARDYHHARHAGRVDSIDRLFTAGLEERHFRQERRLDYQAVYGSLLSLSDAPLPGDARYEPMIARLRAIFDDHAQDGFVVLRYQTGLYFGHLPAA